MRTLEQFNKERQEDYLRLAEWNKPHPNGIACPICGEELWDSDPSCTLTSDPPQKNVHCPGCGYKGYRLA